MSTEWMDQGACRDRVPRETFFNSSTEGTAKDTCHGCPVIGDCYAYALADPKIVGVWGGTTERERSTIRRRDQRHALAVRRTA